MLVVPIWMPTHCLMIFLAVVRPVLIHCCACPPANILSGIDTHKTIVSSVISALLHKHSLQEYLVVEPAVPSQLGTPGSFSPLSWISIPLSKPSMTKYQSYSTVIVLVNYWPTVILFGLDWLKIIYEQLPKHHFNWGPKIFTSLPWLQHPIHYSRLEAKRPTLSSGSQTHCLCGSQPTTKLQLTPDNCRREIIIDFCSSLDQVNTPMQLLTTPPPSL